MQLAQQITPKYSKKQYFVNLAYRLSAFQFYTVTASSRGFVRTQRTPLDLHCAVDYGHEMPASPYTGRQATVQVFPAVWPFYRYHCQATAVEKSLSSTAWPVADVCCSRNRDELNMLARPAAPLATGVR